jgi:plasmid stabilization system protein ParE
VVGHVVRLLPEAIGDLRRNELWYGERSESAAQALLAEFDHAIRLIGESPGTWPRWRRGTHRFILTKFPISVVYRMEGSIVFVVAVAHAKQRPEYWRSRRLS